MQPRTRRYAIAAVVVLSVWALVRVWTSLVPELWWFGAVSSASGSDYAAVFKTMLWTRILVFLAVATTLIVLGVANIWIVHRLAPHSLHRIVRSATQIDLVEIDLRGFLRRLLYGLSVAFSLLLAYSATTQWEVVQRFIHSSGIAFRDAAGEPIVDPLFGNNVAFYLLRLPVLQFVNGWLMAAALSLSALITALYFFYGGLISARNHVEVSRPIGAHLGAMYALTFLLLAWRHWLDRFELLYTQHAKFFGAGYVEVHARLPVLWILVVLCAVTAVAYVVSIILRRSGPALLLSGVYLGTLVVAGGVYPQIVSQFRVRPNEQDLQREYIGANIKMTRAAFGLDDIVEHSYEGASDFTLDDVSTPSIASNVRLWDPRPLLEVYQQSQELRPQYDFADVDIDRYAVGDLNRQVHVAARELDASQLSAGAQTWLNRTFNYTHGYGVVVSPVNEVDEGKPRYYAKDIPLAYDPQWNHPVSETPGPRIYFGERTDHYVVVDPTQAEPREFDYPIEGENYARYTYQGLGGVPLGTYLRRLTYAARFGEYNLLLSSEIGRGSRILYHRNVLERAERIAPFLRYDADPYLVVANGRAQWIVDAYMTTYRYPYSRPLEDSYRQFIRQTRGDAAAVRVLPRGVPWGNYVRNSVKVVIDAYDGTVTFYRLDQDPALGVSDPLLESYGRMFPSLFRPFTEMPPELRAHVRYPRTLFWIQAMQLQAYHMTNPDTFYLEEDLWDLSWEIYEEEKLPVEPYYVTMSLPGENQPKGEFLLIYPFTPRGKLVMSAWMAARCDYSPEAGSHQYGQIVLYRFPKGAQMFGPEQWESEFGANAEFSNWKKVQSADVKRGNLMLFPLPDGILAVEPIYLFSTAAPIPMLRQVMVGYVTYGLSAGRIRSVMGENLADAFSKLLGDGIAVAPTGDQAPDGAEPASTLVPQPSAATPGGTAYEVFERARDALRREDWAEYGRRMEELGRMLKRMDANASR